MASPGASPYQPPSLAPEVKAAPRPPGKPAVWLWAMFALALGTPNNLWTPTLRRLVAGGLSGAYTVIGVIGIAASFVGLIWAYVTDVGPLLGSRREGHLLLGCAITVAAWAVAPFVPPHLAPGFGVDFALRLGAAVCLAALHGAIVELARRHHAPGRFAAANLGLVQAAGLMSTPLFWLLGEGSVSWIAALGAGLALSMGMAAIVSEDSEGPSVDPVDEPPRTSPLLRSKTFWVALAFLIGARLLGDVQRSSFLMGLRMEALRQTSDVEGPASGLAVLGVAVAYALLSRRLSTGTLLRLALIARAAGFATWLPVGSTGSDDWFGNVPRAVADACMMVATTTLVLRAAPRGREAFGYALLVGIPQMIGAMLPILLLPLGWHVAIAVTIASSLLAALAVSLLPAELRKPRDGLPSPTPSAAGSPTP